MSYYQEIVGEYLNSERSRFISNEFLLDIGDPLAMTSGHAFWVDIAAVDFDRQTIFLCEVSYSRSLAAIRDKLRVWSARWEDVRAATFRASKAPSKWAIMPWIFAPNERHDRFFRWFDAQGLKLPRPTWTDLECVAPWKRDDQGVRAMKEAGKADAD